MSNRKIIVSKKEASQVAVFEKLASKSISRKAGALELGLSNRQVRRKLKRYKEQGVEGLIHKNRGRQSQRKYTPETKKKIFDLARTKYDGFGPVFMAEKLFELDGIKINRETLRLFLIAEGLHKKKKEAIKQRRMRERRECRGELVQTDVSFHKWIVGLDEEWALVKFIDDATSEFLWLEFVDAESTRGVGGAYRNYIELHGAPIDLYLDNHSTYRINTSNPGGEKLTQFAQIAKQVGTTLIHARSPQAKGRVERSFQTDQDRLVKELYLANIKTKDEANKFLRDVYRAKHNEKFAVIAKSQENVHKNIAGLDLDDIFCTTSTRSVQNDWTIRYENRIFQLLSDGCTILRPKDIVTIHERFNEEIFITIRANKLKFNEVKRKEKFDKSTLKPDLFYTHKNTQQYNNASI